MLEEQRILEKQISNAMLSFITEKPFFFQMLIRIPKTFSYELEKSCALGVEIKTGRLHMILNPKKIINFRTSEIEIILEHLLMHIILIHQHNDRLTMGHLFHLAADIQINDSIKGLNTLKSSLRLGQVFGNLLTPKSFGAMKELSQYELQYVPVHQILSYLENCNRLARVEQYDTIDESKIEILGYASIAHWSKDEAHRFHLTSQVKDLLVKCISISGSSQQVLPGFLSHTITEILKAETIDYSSIIKTFYTEIMKSVRMRSWNRPHKKYPHLIKSNTRTKALRHKFLIVLDTSGSMWNEHLLQVVADEVNGLLKQCDEVWIVGGDVEEQFRFQTDGKIPFDKLKLKGGGATDLQFGFDVAAELNVDGIIVFTDGFIPDFNDNGFQSAFVIVPGGIEVPNYLNAFVR